jgi:hypothetical protein
MKQKAYHILNLKILYVITLPLFLLSVTAFAGRIIYVDDDASGLNDSSSWESRNKFIYELTTYIF